VLTEIEEEAGILPQSLQSWSILSIFLCLIPPVESSAIRISQPLRFIFHCHFSPGYSNTIQKMDITQCVEILRARKECTHEDCVTTCFAMGKSLSASSEDDHSAGGATSAADETSALMSDLSVLELLNLFTTLQGERIQVII
jgi:hypothetical protein